jgi:hypothetical protein
MAKGEIDRHLARGMKNPKAALRDPQSVQWPQPTPGPYVVEEQYFKCGCGPLYVMGEDGYMIAVMASDAVTPEQMLADGYLLAASWGMADRLVRTAHLLSTLSVFLSGRSLELAAEGIIAINKALAMARPPVAAAPKADAQVKPLEAITRRASRSLTILFRGQEYSVEELNVAPLDIVVIDGMVGECGIAVRPLHCDICSRRVLYPVNRKS